MMNSPPNEVRHFVHKRIGRAVKGFVTSGFNPLAAAGGFLASDAPVTRTQRRKSALPCGGRLCGSTAFRDPVSCLCVPNSKALTTQSRATTMAVSRFSLPPVFGRCIPPLFDNGRGGCELDLVPGPGGGGTGAMRDVGEATMGRYGSALVPGNHVVNRAVCLRGMLLGNDGLCYNKGQISNKERAWPRGRRPLLTGGDMRAISTAARAGRRLEGATKRLQKIGLMKKPSSRRRIGPGTRHITGPQHT